MRGKRTNSFASTHPVNTKKGGAARKAGCFAASGGGGGAWGGISNVIERAQVLRTQKQTQYSTLRGNWARDRRLSDRLPNARKSSISFGRELLASKCSPFYHQSCLELCHRYRTRAGFTALKPNPTFNSDRKSGAKTKYLL